MSVEWDFRVGVGFDAHRFSQDVARPLVLGGLSLPGPGLEGHSDGDVVTHACIDALLGAAGLGDIGRHFPSEDPRHEGADSLEMLGQVVRMLGGQGWVAVNVDCTVVANAPRLEPHRVAMCGRLSVVVGAPVSVKATTTDGLGALGRGEGIACFAVALLRRG
ncbi:MAG: 2-C-methyl-D-erythritol 2,4-cyclodiphosphate synthase [Acidimicrobiales bacterium]|nr:MAG: 2-C-methyl-D-erythritol 2,4-cyclodiphosphate synthase [Acidimicrobiales bacterium]